MAKVELIAKKGFGVTKKGGRVSVPRDHATFLVKTGFADYAPKAVETVPVPAVTVTVAPKRREYLRRDMKAMED